MQAVADRTQTTVESYADLAERWSSEGKHQFSPNCPDVLCADLRARRGQPAQALGWGERRTR